MKKAEPTERQKNRIRQKLADGTLPRVLPGVTVDGSGRIKPDIGGLRWQDTCFTFWVAVTDGS